MNANICGILLAAGASTRFGADKLLQPLHDRTPIALAALAHLRAAIPHVIAVVRPGAPLLAERLSEAGATVILCANAAHGMGASLAAAVGASGDAAGWVVALADMPYIQPETIAKVAATLAAGAAIAAPAYRGERGHPVGLSPQFFDQLKALHDDEGARSILRLNSSLLTLIEVDDPGVCRDIDTPEDLRRAR
jgi:molybdenum cofactor cytidylyltransferase